MAQLLQLLGSILETAMRDPQTFIEADQVYRSKYRTNDPVCAEEIQENMSEFVDVVCQELAAKDGLFLAEDADEFAFEIFWESVKGYRETAKQMIANGLEFVYLVNYKGEGEGYATKQGSQGLKMFVSKYNYQ